MKNYENLLKELENCIDTLKTGIYKQILTVLLKQCSSINKKTKAVDFDFKSKYNFLELKALNEFYLEIVVTNESIHVIINEFEQMYFYDDEFFSVHFEDVINSLFEGRYVICKYEESNSFFWKLEFSNSDLNISNENIDSSINISKIIETINGVSLIGI